MWNICHNILHTVVDNPIATLKSLNLFGVKSGFVSFLLVSDDVICCYHSVSDVFQAFIGEWCKDNRLGSLMVITKQVLTYSL